MMSAETAEEIGEIAVEAARSTLGPRICTLWLYDAAEEALRPIAIDRGGDCTTRYVPDLHRR